MFVCCCCDLSPHQALNGGTLVEYYLDEDDAWALPVAEVERALAAARGRGTDVRAMAVINPGNPVGNIMDVENMREVSQSVRPVRYIWRWRGSGGGGGGLLLAFAFAWALAAAAADAAAAAAAAAAAPALEINGVDNARPFRFVGGRRRMLPPFAI